jgi:acyl-CoA thioesterase FadM
VRYDECDGYGFLTPAAFVRYMQDIAARDVADAQLTGDGFWVVKRTVISFLTPIPMHTTLELTTYGMGLSRITAQRGYEARIAGGDQEQPLIKAHSLWVYVDARGRPMRMPERTAEIWMPDAQLKVQPDAPLPAFPDTAPETLVTHIRFSETDLMKHLNNAAAVELLDNAVWTVYANMAITPDTALFTPLAYDIEYADSPRFGEQIEVQSWFDPFPAEDQEFTRFQRILRGEKLVLRACSRWMRTTRT